MLTFPTKSVQNNDMTKNEHTNTGWKSKPESNHIKKKKKMLNIGSTAHSTG